MQELDWFWQMVTDMDDDQRRQLLSFWTSTSTVPAGASDLHFGLCTPIVNGAACTQFMLDPLIDWISDARPQDKRICRAW